MLLRNLQIIYASFNFLQGDPLWGIMREYYDIMICNFEENPTDYLKINCKIFIEMMAAIHLKILSDENHSNTINLVRELCGKIKNNMCDFSNVGDVIDIQHNSQPTTIDVNNIESDILQNSYKYASAISQLRFLLCGKQQ